MIWFEAHLSLLYRDLGALDVLSIHSFIHSSMTQICESYPIRFNRLYDNKKCVNTVSTKKRVHFGNKICTAMSHINISYVIVSYICVVKCKQNTKKTIHIFDSSIKTQDNLRLTSVIYVVRALAHTSC